MSFAVYKFILSSSPFGDGWITRYESTDYSEGASRDFDFQDCFFDSSDNIIAGGEIYVKDGVGDPLGQAGLFASIDPEGIDVNYTKIWNAVDSGGDPLQRQPFQHLYQSGTNTFAIGPFEYAVQPYGSGTRSVGVFKLTTGTGAIADSWWWRNTGTDNTSLAGFTVMGGDYYLLCPPASGIGVATSIVKTNSSFTEQWSIQLYSGVGGSEELYFTNFSPYNAANDGTSVYFIAIGEISNESFIVELDSSGSIQNTYKLDNGDATAGIYFISVFVYGGYLYAGTIDGYLFKIDLSTFTVDWVVGLDFAPASNHVRSVLVTDDGDIYALFGTGNRAIVKLNSSGEVQYAKEITGSAPTEGVGVLGGGQSVSADGNFIVFCGGYRYGDNSEAPVVVRWPIHEAVPVDGPANGVFGDFEISDVSYTLSSTTGYTISSTTNQATSTSVDGYDPTGFPSSQYADGNLSNDVKSNFK